MPIAAIGAISQLAPMVQGQMANMNAKGMGMAQMIIGGLAMKKLEKNRPQRFTDKNILMNQKMAQNMASQGLPQQSLNYYTSNINRSLGAGINAILSGGGDLNMIQSLVGGASNQFNQVMAQDAEQKLANQGVLMQQNQNVANENQMNWNTNTYQPYLDKYNRAAQMTNSGMTNFQNGMIGSAGTANAAATGMGGKQEYVQGYDYGLSGNGGYVPPTNVGAPTQGYGTQFQGTNPSSFNAWSDVRLKENYSIVGKSKSGINIYEFSYKGNPTRYRGVMSHEVPFASILNDNGYYSVDYSQIDVEFTKL